LSFRADMCSDQSAYSSAVDITNVGHIQDDLLFSFLDQALQFLTQVTTLLARDYTTLSAITDTPATSLFVIFTFMLIPFSPVTLRAAILQSKTGIKVNLFRKAHSRLP
jgi:hypothetical protein